MLDIITDLIEGIADLLGTVFTWIPETFSELSSDVVVG